MSDQERKIADTRGKFAQVEKGERELNDAGWVAGRLLLSNKRLVLAGTGGKRTVPLSKIEDVSGRYDVNQTIAQVSGYVSVRFGESVVVVAADDHDAFETALYQALLDGRTILVKHPAVAGGVIQDTDWDRARVQIDEEAVNVATASGRFVSIEMDDIGSIETGRRAVDDDERTVVEVEHTEETTSVQTYLSGTDRQGAILASLLSKGEQRSASSIELSAGEKQVLMALYSGVSSFEIPDFVGKDVDEVEESFERLTDLEVLETVRTRREVSLRPRGRNIASKAMSEQ
jgi:taxis protein CheF